MSKREDPLSKPLFPDRPFYATGMLLDAEDFLAEQSYHRHRLARVLAALYGSGTIAGLRVDAEPQAGATREIVITPGLALDRLGRIIEVPSRRCLNIPDWFRAQSGKLAGAFRGGFVVTDLFIRFISCERGRTPAFAASSYDSLDAAVPSRLRDCFELELRSRETEPVPQPLWDPAKIPAPGGDPTKDLHTLILDADKEWRSSFDESTGQWARLDEHENGQDTTSLLLARVSIPATAGANGPELDPSPVQIDNFIRRFIYPPSLLAQLQGLKG